MPNVAGLLENEKIRHSIRDPVRSVIEWWGEATSPLRALPRYIIIGAQRCGTSSLHRYLIEHPAVGAPSLKEVHFFDLNFHRGLGWYRGHFPLRMHLRGRSAFTGLPGFTGEATPYYLFHPRAPHRVADTLPAAKLIVILRNPVRRLISQYYHERSIGFENLPLQEALDLEPRRLEGEEGRMLEDETYNSVSHQHHSYRARGRYAEQLERWFALFRREQILVIEGTRFLGDLTTGYDEVLDFLGLPPMHRRRFKAYNALTYPAIDRRTLTELYDYYRPYNERLYELLGADFEWENSAPDR